IAFLAACNLAWSDEPQRFTPEDMLDIVDVSDGSIALSPDGRSLAFVHPDVEDERNVLGRRPRGSIHIVDLATDELDDGRQLGDGSILTSFPSWSPDGRHLAYFVEDSGESRLE